MAAGVAGRGVAVGGCGPKLYSLYAVQMLYRLYRMSWHLPRLLLLPRLLPVSPLLWLQRLPS